MRLSKEVCKRQEGVKYNLSHRHTQPGQRTRTLPRYATHTQENLCPDYIEDNRSTLVSPGPHGIEPPPQ